MMTTLALDDVQAAMYHHRGQAESWLRRADQVELGDAIAYTAIAQAHATLALGYAQELTARAM